VPTTLRHRADAVPATLRHRLRALLHRLRGPAPTWAWRCPPGRSVTPGSPALGTA